MIGIVTCLHVVGGAQQQQKLLSMQSWGMELGSSIWSRQSMELWRRL